MRCDMKKHKSDGGTLFDMGSGMTIVNVEANGGIVKMSDPVPIGGKMRLSDFVENPDNPQTITDQAFNRLLGKVERIPSGLTAKRIAYVTDHVARDGTSYKGRRVVLSGNKRLRALKRLHGDDAEVPAEWFQDITSMSEDQRREFIVTANVVEGKWIAKLLTSMYDKDELARLMDDADVAAILADLPAVQQVAENQEVDQESFADVMELKIKLTAADRDKAVEVLDGINADDMGAALMTLITEGKK